MFEGKNVYQNYKKEIENSPNRSVTFSEYSNNYNHYIGLLSKRHNLFGIIFSKYYTQEFATVLNNTLGKKNIKRIDLQEKEKHRIYLFQHKSEKDGKDIKISNTFDLIYRHRFEVFSKKLDEFPPFIEKYEIVNFGFDYDDKDEWRKKALVDYMNRYIHFWNYYTRTMKSYHGFVMRSLVAEKMEKYWMGYDISFTKEGEYYYGNCPLLNIKTNPQKEEQIAKIKLMDAIENHWSKKYQTYRFYLSTTKKEFVSNKNEMDMVEI